jgi:uncharacterized protein YhbP (UPF0306 family)
MNHQSIHRDVALLLANCRTATLATVDATGGPHAANVQFVADEQFRLWFVSSPQSAHSRHIAGQPSVAITVFDPADADPAQLRGIQMHGQCIAVDDPAQWQRAWTLYAAKFPFVAEDERLAAAVRNQRFYVITATWLRWIDNRQGFGWKQQVLP